MTRKNTRRGGFAVAAIGVLVCGAAVVAGMLRAPELAPRARAAPDLGEVGIEAVPAPVRPAFVPGPPRLLAETMPSARWAPVLTRTMAHVAPDARSETVVAVDPTTPEGTSNIVLVLDTKRGAAGVLWVHVRLPVLPNGTTGWIRRRALGGYGIVDTHLVVDRERLTATLLRNGRPVFEAPVGVGAPEAETPAGEFYVRDRLTRYSSPFYGPVAFGTSARSAVLTDWPAGGFIGIHGTNQPELLPGRVSHGCIRLRNDDILELDRLMPVGTPVTIR